MTSITVIYEGKFSCKIDVLFLVREIPIKNEIQEKVLLSDIVYFDDSYYIISTNDGANVYKVYKKGKKINKEKEEF